MTTPNDTPVMNATGQPKLEKRSVAGLLQSCFRGWDFLTLAGPVRTVPNHDEIARFVEKAKAGTFLQVLVFNSPEFQSAFAKFRESVGGDEAKLLQWAKDYHASRVAYLVFKGWENFPIKIMKNGDMNDGQHRLLAADFKGTTEIDVLVLPN